MQSAKYLTSPEWIDDQKAAVLFAPFRDKSLNPHSWERKMNFWTDALLECAEIQNELLLDHKMFTNYFERHGKYPKCLDTVMKEMVRTGKLKSVSDFQRQNSSWTHWGFDTFVRRPVTWGLSKLLATDTSADGQVFIIPEQVKRKSEEVLAHHHSQVQHEATDNMMDWSAFRSQCLEVLKSQAECDVVLKQLELDHKLLITKDKEGNTVVKVCSKSETTVQPVQEIELNIFKIQKVMKCLERQIETLAVQSDSHTAEARKLMKEGKKALALHQLRKRRTLQRQIEKKTSCVETLHDIIHRIEDSTSNEMVVKAYESGVRAIQQITGDLTVDKVENVLDDLQQVLEDQQEVNEAIAGVELPGSEVSAADLEMELNNLLAGGGEQGDSKLTLEQNDTSIDNLASSLAAQSLDNLPDVPTSSPGSASKAKSPQRKLEPAL